MAISSTLYSTAVTAGANTTTFTRRVPGSYAATGTYPKMLSLKAADPQKASRAIALTFGYKPDAGDQFPTVKTGRISVTLNVASVLGTTITATVARDCIKELASLLIQDAVIDGLLAGNLE